MSGNALIKDESEEPSSCDFLRPDALAGPVVGAPLAMAAGPMTGADIAHWAELILPCEDDEREVLEQGVLLESILAASNGGQQNPGASTADNGRQRSVDEDAVEADCADDCGIFEDGGDGVLF
jgi:hypothetical protein